MMPLTGRSTPRFLREPITRDVWRARTDCGATAGPAHPAEVRLESHSDQGTAPARRLPAANGAATPVIELPRQLDHLADGDIITICTGRAPRHRVLESRRAAQQPATHRAVRQLLPHVLATSEEPR